MKTMKLGVVLLALLLAAMAMVPMVSAGNSVNYSSVFDLSRLQQPQLNFNSSQKHIVVTNELDPEPNIQASDITQSLAGSQSSGISKFPYGSILYHSKDGVTTVFDADGNQLFVADDAKSTQIKTPGGSMAATHVHGLPAGSVVTGMGNTTYVSNGNVLLFEEIDDITNIKTSIISATSGMQDAYQYIEGINGTPTSQNLGTFYTNWTVPSQPLNSQSGQPVVLWNGLQSNGPVPERGDLVLIQAVLHWNFDSNQWSIAPWLIWNNGSSSYHGNDVTGVATGDVISGQISFISPNEWTVTVKDVTKGTSTGSMGIVNVLPNSNVLLEVYLESWATALNKYMPGSTPFYSFVVKDTNGVNCYPTSVNIDIPTNHPYLTGLGVTNTSYWPNTISNPMVLTTYKQ